MQHFIWVFTVCKRTRLRGGVGPKQCAVARPIHVSNSHTIDWISSNILGDSVRDGQTDGWMDRQTDRRTDGRTDGGDCNIPIGFFLKSVRIIFFSSKRVVHCAHLDKADLLTYLMFSSDNL